MSASQISMNAEEAKRRLLCLVSRSERNGSTECNRHDAEAIRVILAELARATKCQSCDGRGVRWYTFAGNATCCVCSGTGKR